MLNFIKNEDGAVTVDFVVLAAALVGLGFVVMNAVGTSTTGVAEEITGALDSTSVATYSVGGNP